MHAGGGAYDLTNTISAFIVAKMSGYPRMGYIPYIIGSLSYGELITLDDAKIYSPALVKKGGIEIINTKLVSQWHKQVQNMKIRAKR